MNRRAVLKNFVAAGIMGTLPPYTWPGYSGSKTLHIVGLGAAGTCLAEIIRKKEIRANYTCIHSTQRQSSFPDINHINFIPPGEVYKHNGVEVFRSRDMEQKLMVPGEIKTVFNRNDKFVLIAGLGGYTGTNMMLELATLLRNRGKDFYAFCTLPFLYEGKLRRRNGEKVLHALKNNENIKFLELQSIREKYGNLVMREAFHMADIELYKMMEPVIAAS